MTPARLAPRRRTVALAALAGVGLLATLQAAEKVVSTTVSADVVTHYVWRGMVLTDDPVLQPALTLSSHGFSLNVWGSVDLTDVNEDDGDSLHLQEIDYTASYSASPVEGLDLTGGLTYYTFSGLDSTAEVFGTVAFSCLPLKPTLSGYYDVDEGEGWYLNAAVAHTFSLTEKLGLTLSGGVGWGDRKYHEFYFGGTSGSAVSDLLLKATLSYALSDSLSVAVYAGYATLLDHEVQDLGEEVYGESDTAFGGVSVSLSF